MSWEQLCAEQQGVISRAQLVAHGLHDHDVRRLLRRRDLTTLLPGVYVDHTGTPTWWQRAHAAVLYGAPAALAGHSALRATGRGRFGREETGVIEVAVDLGRRVRPQPGLVVRRVQDLDSRVEWHRRPPRMRAVEAVLDVAAGAADQLAAVATLTDAVQARVTTARALQAAIEARARLPRRQLLADVAAGVAAGTDSVLEHCFWQLERAHGLPRGRRQVVLPGGRARHDVLHEDECVVVELDGRAYHSVAADRFRDLERDADAAAAGYLTIRLGWGQVVGQPCVTAARVASVLQQRGWSGEPRRCPSCP